MEGVLINAEHHRTIQRETFTGFPRCKLGIDAGDGCGSDVFKPAHYGTGDALVVKSVEVLSEGLAGMTAREDARQRLNKGTHAGFTPEAAATDLQPGSATETLEMPDESRIGPLTLEAATATTDAGLRPLCGGLEIDLKEICLGSLIKNFITLYSNGGNEAGHTGILNPLSPIFDQEP
jgi:hypothetical protein